MATHPEAQERLLAEALQHLGPDFGRSDEAPKLDVLEVMPYLNQVVLEALRLYPSAAFTRTAKRDIQLGKHLIPEGAEVLVFPYFIHRDPRNYAEPDAFRPERWAENKTGSEQLSLQAQLARETLSKPFLPFSLGKRNCAGRALALVEVRVLLLQILANFKIRKPTPAELTERFPDGCAEFQDWPAMSLTLNPKGHMQVYEPRVR
jgi:cytochrome P450